LNFFNTVPSGRILNRFSNDIGVVDKVLPKVIFDVAEAYSYLLTLFIATFILNPYLIIPGILVISIVIIFMKLVAPAIIRASQLELISRSPMYSFYTQTLSGLVTIRAYNQAASFRKKFSGMLDDYMKANYSYWHSTRFLGLLFDYTSLVEVIVGLTLIIVTRDQFSIVRVGQSVAYILAIYENLQYFLRQGIYLQFNMSSTARCLHYINCPNPEAKLAQSQDDETIKEEWPKYGGVRFTNVCMKYKKDQEYALKNLSFEIKPQEKVGCIGRTGSGKSSIVEALYRMFEIDPRPELNSMIEIDGVNTKELGLHLLRKNISIIPQAPFLFSGTIRSNLDPLGQFSEEQLWNALEEVNLKEYVSSLRNKLDTSMLCINEVFSTGQKQLFSLARTILTNNKIIVFDEATANIDYKTDHFIQQKIKERFHECTMFTITHRLTTIADFDKVLIMDSGVLVEFDEPYKLLVKDVNDQEITNNNTVFAQMVRSTGSIMAMEIFAKCKSHYFEKNKHQIQKRHSTSVCCTA